MRAAFALVMLPLALAGCAADSNTVAPGAAPGLAPAVAHAAGEMSTGTIIAERAVDAPAGAAATDLRSSILTAIGAVRPAAPGPAAQSGDDPETGTETEFIIREDDGGTISVIEGDAARFRRGERVMIIRGPETKLAPLGQA
ncbi:MAG: hypothetical protein ACREFU_17465 [Acetobacteraceae bacterium]